MTEQASDSAKDWTIQGAVLRRLLHGPPHGLDLAELTAALVGANPPDGMASRVERAVDVLVDVGLIVIKEDHYVASRAAVHYRELLTR